MSTFQLCVVSWLVIAAIAELICSFSYSYHGCNFEDHGWWFIVAFFWPVAIALFVVVSPFIFASKMGKRAYDQKRRY